jgi:CRISPR-associated protein Cas5t
MIALEVEVPFANFRKSFARAFAESYILPPPATVYGMLLSLVGERRRRSHLGTRIALGLRGTPKLATVLKKLSRLKYGVPSKQSKLGNAPDYMEVVCGLDLVLFVDSSADVGEPSLERRLAAAVDQPDSEERSRSGVLCMGLSDDLVGAVRRYAPGASGQPPRWLINDASGPIDLPVWVDHVGSADTRWRRFSLEEGRSASPPEEAWITIREPSQL